MQYCKRCLNPENIYGGITFDDQGICSRCRVWEKSNATSDDDAKAKEKKFLEILETYRNPDCSNYDMIIPVSGGKDSLYQVHLLNCEYGFNPLLVTFNHTFNTKTGIYNLHNMIDKLGVDHVRFTPNPQLIPKLCRLSLQKFGDMCWHCHCGIFTYPLRVAVQCNIPLLICQEFYYGLLSAPGGYYTEVDPRHRRYAIRAEADEMVDEELGVTPRDLIQWQRPPQEEIDRIGVRGLRIEAFIKWDSKKITEFLIKEYGFKTREHDRSYDCYANAECHHCSGAHDYLRYLKAGYGRATDDAGIDIRRGLMTREQAIDIVEKYDSVRPDDLDLLLERIGMSEEEFVATVEDKRDPRAWTKTPDGQWVIKDSVMQHRNEPVAKECAVTPCDPEGYQRISNPLAEDDGTYSLI